MQRRRLLLVLAVVLLASSSVVLSGCSNFFTGTTQLTASYDATASTSSAYSVNVTASSGKGMGFCISSINYQWSDEATERQGWASAGLPQCLTSVQRVLKIPTRAGGGTLRVHVVAFDSVPLWPDRDDTWSAPIVIPAALATPGSTTTTTLAAVLFARQSPTYSGGTIIDARQSTGTAPLSYSWSTGCNDTVGLDVGTARVISGFPRTCTVQVTDGTGATASASVALTMDPDIVRNGSISFPSGTQAEIASVTKIGVPFNLESELACVALDGGTAFRTFVSIGTGAAGSLTGRVPLTALTPGVHRISAALFTDPLNANGPWNDAKCATITSPATTAGYMQTVSALYNVAADGSVSAARRGGRTTTGFVAPSSLRFVSKKTITEGTFDKLGAIVGATASGTFSWGTPKASKGVKRPAGAANLAKGTYAMRSISMSPGPKTGASTLLLGTGTVLLRGASGTLACGTISGTFGSSTLTLAGGSGAAGTLAGVVTGKPIGYVFPKPPKKPTKKPSNKPKPKPAKLKPVKAAGTATLQTAAKATALPSACQALVQYLP